MLSTRVHPASAMASEHDTRGATPPGDRSSNVIPLNAAWLYRDDVSPSPPATATLVDEPPPQAGRTTASLWDGSAVAQRAYDAAEGIFPPASISRPSTHPFRWSVGALWHPVHRRGVRVALL